MNAEVKKIVQRVKAAQVKLQQLLKDKTIVEEARKYAEKQGKEIRKLLASDAGKVKAFLEKERKELEKFQKQIPGEVQKFRTLVNSQRREVEKLLKRVRRAGANSGTAKKGPARKRTTTKKKST